MLGWHITVKDESLCSIKFDYESRILAKWEITIVAFDLS